MTRQRWHYRFGLSQDLWRSVLVIALFLVTILVFDIISVYGQGSWQYPDWSYRRGIDATNNTASVLTDYQVLITLAAANFDFTHAKSDGSDIRFTYWNGTSETEIPYWIEQWDSGAQQAKAWTKVPSVPGSGSSMIYLYYGNPSASSASDGPGAFSFFDDFNSDLSKWDSPSCGSASLSIVNGALHWEGNQAIAPVGHCSIMVKAEYNPNLSDMVVETRTRYLSGSTNWIFWGIQGRSNNSTRAHYVAALYPQGQIGSVYTIRRDSAGPDLNPSPLSISAGEWRNIKFILFGNRLQLYDGDAMKVEASDSAYTSGGTGIDPWADGPGGWGIGIYE